MGPPRLSFHILQNQFVYLGRDVAVTLETQRESVVKISFSYSATLISLPRSKRKEETPRHPNPRFLESVGKLLYGGISKPADMQTSYLLQRPLLNRER